MILLDFNFTSYGKVEEVDGFGWGCAPVGLV